MHRWIQQPPPPLPLLQLPTPQLDDAPPITTLAGLMARAAVARRAQGAAEARATLSLAVTWAPTSQAAYPLVKTNPRGAVPLRLATWA